MRSVRLGAATMTRRRPLTRFVIFLAACLAAWIAPGPLIRAASPWAYGAAVLALLLIITRIALWSESLSPGNVAASLFVAACSGGR